VFTNILCELWEMFHQVSSTQLLLLVKHKLVCTELLQLYKLACKHVDLFQNSISFIAVIAAWCLRNSVFLPRFFRKEAMKQTIVESAKENSKKKNKCRCTRKTHKKKKKQLYNAAGDGKLIIVCCHCEVIVKHHILKKRNS